MTTIKDPSARAVIDLAAGNIVAQVDIAAPPERVFRALASPEIVEWWQRDGVFDTREWSGEVRVGGRWRASGVARGQPYALEGEFLEVDPPRALVHTWHPAGVPAQSTTVSYRLEAIPGGTRLVLRHTGFHAPDAASNVAQGWDTSLAHLVERLAGAAV